MCREGRGRAALRLCGTTRGFSVPRCCRLRLPVSAAALVSTSCPGAPCPSPPASLPRSATRCPRPQTQQDDGGSHSPVRSDGFLEVRLLRRKASSRQAPGRVGHWCSWWGAGGPPLRSLVVQLGPLGRGEDRPAGASCAHCALPPSRHWRPSLSAEDSPRPGLGDGKGPWPAQGSGEPRNRGWEFPGPPPLQQPEPQRLSPRLHLWRKGKLMSAGPVRSRSRVPLSRGWDPSATPQPGMCRGPSLVSPSKRTLSHCFLLPRGAGGGRVTGIPVASGRGMRSAPQPTWDTSVPRGFRSGA